MERFLRVRLLILIVILSSCVGAVNENQSDVDVNKDSLKTKLTFSFEGPVKVESLSDTKVAIYFNPAVFFSPQAAAAAEEEEGVGFIYQVFMDGSESPMATLLDINLRKNIEGLYYGELDVGSRGTCASFTMGAKLFSDPEQTVVSQKNVAGCSMNEFFPSFNGIFSAASPEGCNRYTGAKLTWKVAKNSDELDKEITRYEELLADNLANFSNQTYADFIANDTRYREEISSLEEYETGSYKIYYADSEEALTEYLNSSEIPDSVITVDDPNLTSFNIPGLESGKTYYFSVRASSGVISSTNKKNLEKNSKIIEYTIPSKEPMQFAGISSVDIPSNSEGYNSAVLRFTPCVGCDKYHFYAKPNSTPLSSGDTPIETVSLDEGGIESYKALGLGANTPYYFYVVAEDSCGGVEAVTRGEAVSIPKTTTPPLAPYNGLATITEMPGSLDRLKLNWELPDLTSGVYGNYAIYQVDEEGNNPVKLRKDFHATDPYISSLAGDDDPDNYLSSSSVILNLNAGTDIGNAVKYCFKVVIEEDLTYGTRALDLDSAPHQCYDFYYKAPNFAGPRLGGCNPTGSSFDISYDVPTTGTFQKFRLYYKVAGTDTVIDYDTAMADTTTVTDGKSDIGTNGFTRIEFDFNADTEGFIDTPVFAGDVPVNPFTITGLIPATKYIFAMETYYDPDGDGPTPPYYVRPNVFRTCTTREPEVIHNGWEHIMALGIKHDGLNKVDVNEGLSVTTKAAQTSFMSGGIADTDKLSVWSIDELGGVASTEGIVELSWYDFKISGLGTYANSLVASGNTMTYQIQRSVNPDMAGADVVGSVDLADGVYLYNFSDETGLTAGTTYYYRVVLQKNNLDVVFANVETEDIAINDANKILKVIVPPKNMAFIHRYMFNKHQCTRINKSINHGFHTWPDLKNGDPNTLDFADQTYLDVRSVRGSKYLEPPLTRNYDITESYRCEYNGMGSTLIGGTYYFDIGKHFLVDRFGVGVNIGADACNLDSGGENCIGYWGDTSNINTDHLGRAAQGTTFYRLSDRNYDTRYNIIVNTSFVEGTSWERLADLSDDEYAQYAPGMFSNNAYLPPARLSQEEAIKYCSYRTETIDGVDHTPRLGSRQEYIVFGAWHDNLSPKDIVKLETRLMINGENDITKYGCLTKEESNTEQWYGMDYDLVPYNPNAFDKADLSSNFYPAVSLIDWTADNRGGSTWDRSQNYKTGSFSSDTNHSSHLCVSKFGVQDIVGNLPEITIDTINKTGTRGDSRDFEMSPSLMPEEVRDYWLNTATATPAPMGPLITDYYNSTSGMVEFYPTSDNENRFYNPLTATSMACDSTAWGVTGDCWDILQESADALLGRPDRDNYIFSNVTADYNYRWVLPSTEYDLRPGVLSLVGAQEGYKPYMYDYRQYRQKFSDTWNYTGNYAVRLGSGIGRDDFVSDSLYSVDYARNSDTTWGRGKFRCVVPLED